MSMVEIDKETSTNEQVIYPYKELLFRLEFCLIVFELFLFPFPWPPIITNLIQIFSFFSLYKKVNDASSHKDNNTMRIQFTFHHIDIPT